MHRLREAARSLPLARKILLINGAVAFVAWSLAVGLILLDQYRAASQDLALSAQHTVASAARELAAQPASAKWTRAPLVLAGVGSKPNVLGVALYDEHGALVTRTGESLAIPPSFRVSGDDTAHAGPSLIAAHESVVRDKGDSATVVVWMGTQGITAKVVGESYPLMVMAAAGSLCVVLLVWLLLPLTVRRLGRLTQAIRAVTQEQNYAIRANVKGRDEIGELALAFNTMLDQIQSRDESLRNELAERQRAQKQTAYLASHDAVTGLPNRRFFSEALAFAQQNREGREGQVAVLLLDIDNFKMVNDSLGHRAGDQLLSEAGVRLRGHVGTQDLVCRVGGDEFAVILDAVASEARAEEIGKDMILALTRPMRVEGSEVSLRASVGIALAGPSTSAEELMRNADTAMHQAKSAGKGLVRTFRAYMNDRVQHRLTLEQDLRKAVESDQLILYYQPQFDATTGKIVGAEALMRWNHPKFGAISPVQFIPIAEESGLIVLLGAWAMLRASAEAKAWQEHGLEGVSVSVNVSARQFMEPNFVATVSSALAQSGLDGRLLELELTESLLVDQHGTSLKNLNALRDQGIALAIDDFGTGYSSMSYLKRFPMQRLKIDRSFIQNIPHETDDMAIAGAMIALGHKLGMEIVAEGVENRAQYNFLVDQACDRIQGFLFSKPLPLEEMLSTYGSVQSIVPEYEAQRLSA